MLKISKILAFLTIVLMPSYIVRSALLGIPMTLLEVLILSTVLFTLGASFQHKQVSIFFSSRFHIFIYILLASAIIGLFFTPDLRGGMGIFKAYFLEPILFFYALRYILIKEKSYIFVVRGLIISAGLICLLGFIQKVTGQFSLAPQEMILGRVSGIYNSANAVALFIGPVIPFLVVLFIKHKDIYKKIFFLGLLLFFSLIMFWTKSRGGLVAEVFSLSILFFGLLCLRFKKLKRFWYIIPIIFVLFCGLFFLELNQLYFEKTTSVTPIRIQNDTLQIRYATWISTITMLLENVNQFIFGVGLNGFHQEYPRYKLDNFVEDFQYPHNIILNFWTELGILGVLGFIGLIFYIFSELIRLNKDKIDLFALALIGSFSFMIVHGLVDVPYFKNDLSLQFWVLVALVEIIVIQKSKQSLRSDDLKKERI